MSKEAFAISKICKVYKFDGESIKGLDKFVKPGKLILEEYGSLALVPSIAGESDCHYCLKKGAACYLVRFPGGDIERYSPVRFEKNFQLFVEEIK